MVKPHTGAGIFSGYLELHIDPGHEGATRDTLRTGTHLYLQWSAGSDRLGILQPGRFW
jgi:hypothetical protein